jgi:hypothetical protein
MDIQNDNNINTCQASNNDKYACYNTFIIHNIHIGNNNWRSDKINTSKSNQPNFNAFDHGDHIHILFPEKFKQNTNRTITRIHNWFKATSAGIAEAYTSLQRVKSIKQYHFKLTLTNQATKRKRLLTQGTTNTITRLQNITKHATNMGLHTT